MNRMTPEQAKKLKVGDKIRCLDTISGDPDLIAGEIYIVKYVSPSGTSIIAYNIKAGPHQSDCGWMQAHFELITQIAGCVARCPGCKGKCELWEAE